MSEKIIQISKITANRQVTIPAEIMDRLGIKRGDKILWVKFNDHIIIRKV